MRSIVQTAYTWILRFIGAYTLWLVAQFVAKVPERMEAGQFVGVPIGIAIFTALVGLVLLYSRLTPSFIARPSKMRHLFTTLIPLGLLPLLFAVIGTMISIGFDLPKDESMRHTLILIILPLLASSLAWWAALALCIWPSKGGSDDTQKPSAPEPTQSPQSPDHWQARLSRMS